VLSSKINNYYIYIYFTNDTKFIECSLIKNM